MTHSIGSMSFSVGVDPVLVLAQQAADIEKGSASIAPTKPPTPKLRRRARDAEGQFKPDDPATPQDEAWEDSTNSEPAAPSL
jgi:hypothetical protein